MTTPFEFDDLAADATPEERQRLRRVHDLLVAAGPPPELTPALRERPGRGRAASVTPLPREIPRRRLAAAVVLAATLVLAAFGVGFLLGGGDEFEAAYAVKMHGTEAAPRALASIQIGEKDAAGNHPMRLIVQGLKEQPPGDYYELYLVRNEKFVGSCGTFRVRGDRTEIDGLNAPYELKKGDEWVVTAHRVGEAETEPTEDDFLLRT